MCGSVPSSEQASPVHSDLTEWRQARLKKVKLEVPVEVKQLFAAFEAAGQLGSHVPKGKVDANEARDAVDNLSALQDSFQWEGRSTPFFAKDRESGTVTTATGKGDSRNGACNEVHLGRDCRVLVRTRYTSTRIHRLQIVLFGDSHYSASLQQLNRQRPGRSFVQTENVELGRSMQKGA